MANIRESILTVCRVLVNEGLVTGFGHVSARMEESDRFVMTPGLSLAVVNNDDLLVFCISGGHVLEGKTRPAIESILHTVVYQSRPDVNAIVRAQPRYAEAFGVTGQELRPQHQTGASLKETVPVHMNPELIETETQAKDLVDTLADRTAVIMRGSGVVVTGRTLREAALRAIFLEDSAQLEYRARQLGEPVYYTNEELKRFHEASFNERAQERAWAYYVSKAPALHN